MTIPTNPTLWKHIKKKYRDSAKGGKAGRWSSRKAILSQLQYAKQGGEWAKTTKPKRTAT